MGLKLGFFRSLGLSWLALSHVPAVGAIQLDVNDPSSLKKAAKTAAEGMLTWYHGNLPGYVPGDFEQDDIYWWLCGAMFMTLIEYWSLTGDDSYNHLVTQGMLFQVGSYTAFEPQNQTTSEANDDQEFWGFAAITAAELKFPNPPPDQPQWLELAQGVFNRISARWDTTTCDGGLRWQFLNVLGTEDHNYKNTISNAGFFQLAARLGTYTGNYTYVSWAEKTFDWILNDTPIINGTIDSGYVTVYDGAEVPDCSPDTLHIARFSYNYGSLINGAAYLYSYYAKKKNEDKMHEWFMRLKAVVYGSTAFYPNDPSPDSIAVTDGGSTIICEIQCEVATPPSKPCNNDQVSFKGYYFRWLTSVLLLLSKVEDGNADDAAEKDKLLAWIRERLIDSAQGAAKQCSGGDDGNTCGVRWWQAEYDGTASVGQQMAAMSVFQNNLVRFIGPIADQGDGKNDNGHGDPVAPLTADTGGNSAGNPSAGTEPTDTLIPLKPITTGDRAGAGILTILITGATAYLVYFMVFSPDDMLSPVA